MQLISITYHNNFDENYTKQIVYNNFLHNHDTCVYIYEHIYVYKQSSVDS